MFRISLPVKLMLSYVLVGALMLVPAFFLLRPALTDTLVRAERQQLLEQATALRGALGALSGDGLQSSVRQYGDLLRARISVIAVTGDRGTLLADSQLSPTAVTAAAADNHAARPEVRAALTGDTGFALRRSQMLGEEYLYVAVRMDDGRTGADAGRVRVLRLASKRALLAHTADQAIAALRIGGGVGISAALLLSLVAALYVASPLRRMTKVAQAFAQANWVAVHRLKSGDELEDLSVALDELGKQLRRQLVALGAAEATLVQTLDALSTPALILRDDSTVLHKNGAFRRALSLRPEGEDAAMAELIAAFAAAQRDGGTTDGRTLHFTMSTPTGAGPVRLAAYCIARPAGTPWWLVIVDGRVGDRRDARSVEPSQELMLSSDAIEVVSAEDLISRCIRQVETDPQNDHGTGPDGGRIAVAPIPDVMLAEPSGRSGRALRRLLQETLRGAGTEGALRVTCAVEPAHLMLRVNGAAPDDLAAVVRLARALGTDAGADEGSDSGGAWLRLPRA